MPDKTIRDLGFLFIFIYLCTSLIGLFFYESIFDSFQNWKIYKNDIYENFFEFLPFVFVLWLIKFLRKKTIDNQKIISITDKLLCYVALALNISILSLLVLLIQTKENSGESYEDIISIQFSSFAIIYFALFILSKPINTKFSYSKLIKTIESFLNKLKAEEKKND
jgi:hypothetical protein